MGCRHMAHESVAYVCTEREHEECARMEYAHDERACIEHERVERECVEHGRMECEKAQLRAQLRARLSCLDAGEAAQSSAAIVQNLLQSGIWNSAQTVFCYVGDVRRGEVDTLPLLRAALAEGKTLAVPLCTAPGVMEARILHAAEDLRPGRFGLLEPPAASALLLPEKIALCVVPCLSAAPDGTRLGYGGGYYDRFLPQAENAVYAALCRAALLSPALPCEAHDVRMHCAVTERGIRSHDL